MKSTLFWSILFCATSLCHSADDEKTTSQAQLGELMTVTVPGIPFDQDVKMKKEKGLAKAGAIFSESKTGIYRDADGVFWRFAPAGTKKDSHAGLTFATPLQFEPGIKATIKAEIRVSDFKAFEDSAHVSLGSGFGGANLSVVPVSAANGKPGSSTQVQDGVWTPVSGELTFKAPSSTAIYPFMLQLSTSRSTGTVDLRKIEISSAP